ncbi:MAG: 30S ribosomal protein S6 [Alphaproteobacteria bacterium]|nr:30S ribosomal protein S6 [Alphaproteobacteria bacterium]
MPYYESVFIARQDVSSTQVEQLTDQFAEVVAGLGGEVKKREYWGLRNLAYKVNKNRKGHYVLFNLDAPSDAVTEMERLMRLNEDVLRYMTIRVDELEDGPSIMMQAKSDRDRGRGGREGGRGDRDHRDRGDRGDRRERDSAPRDNASKGDAE